MVFLLPFNAVSVFFCVGLGSDSTGRRPFALCLSAVSGVVSVGACRSCTGRQRYRSWNWRGRLSEVSCSFTVIIRRARDSAISRDRVVGSGICLDTARFGSTMRKTQAFSPPRPVPGRSSLRLVESRTVGRFRQFTRKPLPRAGREARAGGR